MTILPMYFNLVILLQVPQFSIVTYGIKDFQTVFCRVVCSCIFFKILFWYYLLTQLATYSVRAQFWKIYVKIVFLEYIIFAWINLYVFFKIMKHFGFFSFSVNAVSVIVCQLCSCSVLETLCLKKLKKLLIASAIKNGL